jgi:ketosteroid isomerase-like protein
VDVTSRTRETVRAYVDSAERRDWSRFAGLLDEDVMYELPQTRERIRGRAAFVQFNREYPGDWHLRVRRVVADGAFAAAWLDTRVDGGQQDACVWFECTGDGRIARVVDYWPEAYEPPPGREHLVERY